MYVGESSVKKKAKKKAAAARKGDGTENGEADGLEAAGTNGGVEDSPEAHGAEPGDSNGTASKKKKSKGMCLQLQRASTQCLCMYRSSVAIKSAVPLYCA